MIQVILELDHPSRNMIHLTDHSSYGKHKMKYPVRKVQHIIAMPVLGTDHFSE